MSTAKNSYSLLAIISATAASLCCIAPLLAMVAGLGGLASSFSWLEPFRPYLIVLTLIVLAVAWYQKLKPIKEGDCNCEPQKKPFLQKKAFLVLVSIFALLMLGFPYYSASTQADQLTPAAVSAQNQLQTAEFKVSGMTCSGCENHITQSVSQLSGIHSVLASYQKEKATVVFDGSKTKREEIIAAINKTGYTVEDSL